MTKKHIAISAGAVCLCLFGSALAGPFMQADADADGMLSRQEALDAAAAAFDRVDENADGYVSDIERDAARETVRQRLEERRGEHRRRYDGAGRAAGDDWQARDTDGDGLLSRAESEAAASARFETLDADGDGFVAKEEVRAKRAAAAQAGRESR